ncbi:MAG: nitroreductase family protein [Elusimicrobia bacterium]|nr:nitroreductase family protein [Elusimicrobiota bacterium]
MKSAELLELIKSRRSIRKFKPGEIPQADIETAIMAGGFAPSNGNSQPWRFIYVKDQVVKRELGEIVKNNYGSSKKVSLTRNGKKSLRPMPFS